MAGVVVNIKVCSPLKLCSGLTGNYNAICHYSYNLPLAALKKICADTHLKHISLITFALTVEKLSNSQFLKILLCRMEIGNLTNKHI